MSNRDGQVGGTNYDGSAEPASITGAAYARMAAYCLSAAPDEACGLLTASMGLSGAGGAVIDGVVPIRNAAADPRRHFSFHSEDWIRAYYDAEKNRQSIVGFFHSHPDSAPVPSPSDEAGWPDRNGAAYTYWIVSLWNAERPACCAYRRRTLEDGSSVFAQVRIQIA